MITFVVAVFVWLAVASVVIFIAWLIAGFVALCEDAAASLAEDFRKLRRHFIPLQHSRNSTIGRKTMTTRKPKNPQPKSLPPKHIFRITYYSTVPVHAEAFVRADSYEDAERIAEEKLKQDSEACEKLRRLPSNTPYENLPKVLYWEADGDTSDDLKDDDIETHINAVDDDEVFDDKTRVELGLMPRAQKKLMDEAPPDVQ